MLYRCGRVSRSTFIVAAVLLVFGSIAHAAEDGALVRLLGSPPLRGARGGLLVIDRETGQELLAHEASRPLVPASTVKLVTAAAALAHLGPAHRFETPVLGATALTRRGVLEGDLWVVGRGDPSLVSEELWRLAEELRILGLREVRGRIAVDATYLDRVLLHPGWANLSRRAYHAPVSAFSANYSSFRIDVSPGSDLGQPLALVVAPRIPYFHLEPGGRTLARPGNIHLELLRTPDGLGEIVRARGSMQPGEAPRTYWRSVVSPEIYAAELLRSQLEAQGIVVRGRGVRVGLAPETAHELLRFRGETLGRIVWKLNKFSNNFIAEQLTKTLGAERFGPPGSWSKGLRALREHLDEIGGLGPGERLVDGSGLAPRNRLSAATLVRVLHSASTRFDTGPDFLASLPLGGRDGTLEDRLEEHSIPLRAKTGHLSGVAALCGTFTDREDRVRLFAILVNGARGSAEKVDEVIDSFVAQIAGVADLPDQGAVGAGSAARTRAVYPSGSVRPPRR